MLDKAREGASMSRSTIDARQRAELCRNLLGPLSDHFNAAGKAYADYLQNGKSFRFACALRRINGSARALLVDHRDLLPEELQGHAAALVHHYDVWMALWDDLAAAGEPGMEDPFVFENPVRFPRESQRALLECYDQLRR
jgi:hypothetical protein